MDTAILIIEIIVCVIGIAWAIIVHNNIYKHYHYHCNNCGKDFKPNKFLASMFGLNGGKSRHLRCTNCGKSDWRELIKD